MAKASRELTEAIFERWLRHIHEIHRDLSVFVHSAFIYGEMLRVVERNPEINKPSQIHSWYERNYGAICSSLRRMVDRSSDGASLRPPQPSERSLVVRARAVDGRRKRRLDPGENAGIG